MTKSILSSSKELIYELFKFSKNQGYLRATCVFSLILLEKLLKRKLLKHCYIRFICSYGYRFIARCDDWWRFLNHFEPKTSAFIERQIFPNDVIFDVGAHIGLHTIHFAKKAQFVVAIEPEPSNFYLLTRNIKLNRANNVLPLQLAISNYDGYADLYISEHSGAHTISHNFVAMKSKIKYENKIKVKCKRIDSLFRTLNLDKVDVVKIDGEGGEREVLGDMTNLLAYSPPRILIIEVDREDSYYLSQFLREYYSSYEVLDSWKHRVNLAFYNAK